MRHRVSKFDVFPKFDAKFEQDARQRTVLGGMFSLFSLIAIAVLIVGEVRYYFSTVEQHEMYVDTHIGGVMDITVNITFPRVPCDLITADAVNSFGTFAEDAHTTIIKTRVDSDTLNKIGDARPLVGEKKIVTNTFDEKGNEKENCPSCYGAESEPGACCHTCDDVKRAYALKNWVFNEHDIGVQQCAKERLERAAQLKNHEGCNVYAKYNVARVTGNIHFIPGRMFTIMGYHLHDLQEDTVRSLNLSHIFHTLEFGEKFPGQLNPLEGLVNIHGAVDATEPVSGRFSYFVKIVPTQYQTSAILGFGGLVESNQYSVTHHFTPLQNNKNEAEKTNVDSSLIPGVFVTYDLSPIKVSIYKKHPYTSVVHLFLQLCAVCGGIFTVAGLIDYFCYYGIFRVVRKLREGKQS